MRVTVRGSGHRLRSVAIAVGIVTAVLVMAIGVVLYNKNAQAAIPPDSCFTMSGGTITAYSTIAGCPKNVDIPSTIGGVTVTGIGTQAFFNKALTAVSIPSTVTSIGSMAFYLNQITSLPAYFSNPAVTTIPQYAFAGNRFTSLTIPANITTIEPYAFQSNLLTNAIVPSTVSSLGSGSFAYNQLTSITVQGDPATLGSGVVDGNNNIATVTYDGTAYTSAQSNDATCFATSGGIITGFRKADLANIKTNGQACLNPTLVIPSSVSGTPITRIGSSSLSSKGFTSVTIPNTITTIDTYALFSNQFIEITIPASVTSIGDYALYNNQITQAVFQGNPTTVGANVLRNNPVQSLTYAGATYTSANSPIDESCFEFNSTTGAITGFVRADPATVKATGKACMALQLVVPAEIGGVTVTEITGSGFQNLGLTSVDIPSTITKVTSSAFRGNAIVIPEMPSWTPSDITSLLTQPANVTVDGVPMTISTNLSTGSTTGTHIDAIDYILHRFDGKWYPGQWQADSQITAGRTLTIEVEGDFSKLEDFSAYISDAEQTTFRVYGFDADGNRVDVSDWIVTDQRADESGPAIRPNPHTVLADSIEFGNPTAPGSVNDDTMRVRLQGASLTPLKKFVLELTSASTGDWVEWGFLGRAPTPDIPVDPTNPETPSIPGIKAPNAGAGSPTYGFAVVAGMLIVIVGAAVVLRRRGTM